MGTLNTDTCKDEPTFVAYTKIGRNVWRGSDGTIFRGYHPFAPTFINEAYLAREPSGSLA